MRMHLKYYLENIETKEVINLEDQMVFGRRSKCDVLFKDDLVSGYHCKFHVCSENIFVEDLKASNPLKLNGSAIEEATKYKLKHNDSVKIGVAEFILINVELNLTNNSKSLSLEKNSSHEVIASDISFNEDQNLWKKESKQKLKIKNLKAKVKVSSESKYVISSLKKEFTLLHSKKEEISNNLKNPNEYNLDELKEYIEFFSIKLEEVKVKKDEITNIYNQVIIYKETNSQLHTLKKRILQLEESYDESEFKKLTKEYESALTDLNKLKKKAS